MTVTEPVWTPGSFLSLITAEECELVLALGVSRWLPAGRRLLVEDEADTHVEIIQQGHVKVTATVGGEPKLLAIRLPGDLVGEMAAFAGGRRSATVTASVDVFSTVIQRAAFLEFLARHPEVSAQVTATLGRRLRWANERRLEFSAFPVHVRLARILSEIAASCGEQVEGGRLITVVSQAELATLVGAGEDTVQRGLRKLRERKLVRTRYHGIVVLDEPGLRALVDEAEWR